MSKKIKPTPEEWANVLRFCAYVSEFGGKNGYKASKVILKLHKDYYNGLNPEYMSEDLQFRPLKELPNIIEVGIMFMFTWDEHPLGYEFFESVDDALIGHFLTTKTTKEA